MLLLVILIIVSRLLIQLYALKSVQNVLKVFFLVSILESVDMKEKVLDAASFVSCVCQCHLQVDTHVAAVLRQVVPRLFLASLGFVVIGGCLAAWPACVSAYMSGWGGGRVEHLLAPREGLMNQ